MADLSLSKMSWQAQLVVFVVLSIASAGAFYYFYEMPQQAEMETRKRDLAAVNARVDKARATARQLSEFQKEVTGLKARLQSLKPILPEEKDAADLLRRVNTLAAQANLEIRGFRPQAINTREMHAEWPIALELEGNYHNLGEFLDSVSKFPRIINVSALDIKAKPQPTAESSIEITCTATTFVLIDTPAAPPTKKGAAPKAPAKTE